MSYDNWKCSEPDPFEFDERPTDEDEVRQRIETLIDRANKWRLAGDNVMADLAITQAKRLAEEAA